jgi:hypothetical protein
MWRYLYNLRIMPGPQSQTAAEKPPETGTTPGAATQENADKDKDKENKEKADMNKMLLKTFGEGVSGDINKGLKAYGEFIMALEKLGAVDIIDLLQKGFTVWQVEAEIKKALEGKLIPKERIGGLTTEIQSAKSGENLGEYITRCLGLNFPEIPKRPDGKESDPLMVSLMWFKTSGVVNLLGYNAVKDGLKADETTKKPILYENDLVYINTGEKKYTAGFIKDFDKDNEKIKVSTMENGQVVIKDFELKSVLMAFHFAGNKQIMKRSLDEGNPFEPANVPEPAPGAAPTPAPGAAPAPSPTPAPGAAPAPAPATTPAPAPQPAAPSGPAATPPAAST